MKGLVFSARASASAKKKDNFNSGVAFLICINSLKTTFIFYKKLLNHLKKYKIKRKNIQLILLFRKLKKI